MDGSLALTFGRFELQARHRRLMREGEPVSMGARAFDVLLALAERRERIVTKTELMDLVWPGLVVEDATRRERIVPRWESRRRRHTALFTDGLR